MRTIVLDLELAQPSKKIIQIGATCLDLRSGTTIGNFMTFVNPEEELSPFIMDLCNISQKDVDNGEKLPNALMDFWNWTANTVNCRNLAAWGSDVYLLIEASKDYEVIYPHKLKSLNIKEMASVMRTALPATKARGGLKSTMEAFGLTFEGRQHDALTDSLNTAKLLFYWKEEMRKMQEMRKML